MKALSDYLAAYENWAESENEHEAYSRARNLYKVLDGRLTVKTILEVLIEYFGDHREESI